MKHNKNITEKEAIESVRHEVALDLIKKYGKKLKFQMKRVKDFCDIPHNFAPSLSDKKAYLETIWHKDDAYFKNDENKLDYLNIAEDDEIIDDEFSYFFGSGIKESCKIDDFYPRDALFLTIYTRANSLKEIKESTAAMLNNPSIYVHYKITPQEWEKMQNFIFKNFEKRVSNIIGTTSISNDTPQPKLSIFTRIMKRHSR